MSLGHEHGLVLIGLAGPMDVVNLSLSLSHLDNVLPPQVKRMYVSHSSIAYTCIVHGDGPMAHCFNCMRLHTGCTIAKNERALQAGDASKCTALMSQEGLSSKLVHVLGHRNGDRQPKSLGSGQSAWCAACILRCLVCTTARLRKNTASITGNCSSRWASCWHLTSALGSMERCWR